MITKMERLKVKKHTVDSLSYCVGSADHDHDHHIYASHDNHDCHDNHDKKTGVSVDDEGRKGKRGGGGERGCGNGATEPANLLLVLHCHTAPAAAGDEDDDDN